MESQELNFPGHFYVTISKSGAGLDVAVRYMDLECVQPIPFSANITDTVCLAIADAAKEIIQYVNSEEAIPELLN